MENFRRYIYLSGALIMPWIALAHGGVDDEHPDLPIDVSHPEYRMYVLGGVVIACFLLGFFWWWSKRKNAPSPFLETPKQ